MKDADFAAKTMSQAKAMFALITLKCSSILFLSTHTYVRVYNDNLLLLFTEDVWILLSKYFATQTTTTVSCCE